MSKKVVVSSSAESDIATSLQNPTQATTDWSKCIICQEDGEDRKVCPASQPNSSHQYETFVSNLHEFKKLGTIPLDLNPERLDEGKGIQKTLEDHASWWHKKCGNRFDSYHLSRAKGTKKRKALDKVQECSPVKTRSSLGIPSQTEEKVLCFFCDGEVKDNDNSREVMTPRITENVQRAATTLCDRRLLAKLAGPDLRAQDAKYHAKCLCNLYYRETVALRDKPVDRAATLKAFVLAELVSYIEDCRSSEICPVFLLSDLVKMYTNRLLQLGVDIDSRLHSTRLKESLLKFVPGLTAHSQGPGLSVSLVFEADVSTCINKAALFDDESDAITLAKAAAIVRRDMFQSTWSFDGSFKPGCQQICLPHKLATLVNMMLEGPSIKEQSANNRTEASQTISQLVMFNSVKHQRKSGPNVETRHNRDRETPFPIYLSMLIHANTRKKELIDIAHSYGLCLSYKRLLDISSDLGNKVCNYYHLQNVVCPPVLKSDLFTTGASDNFDHNPSSRTSKDSYHGTAISLTQHPTSENPGIERNIPPNKSSSTGSKILPLPQFYTEVPPVGAYSKDTYVPAVQGAVRPGSEIFQASFDEENKWLDKMSDLNKEAQDLLDEYVSWAAHHASVSEKDTRPHCTSALLPLFDENAHTLSMVRHSMDVIRQAIQHVNPNQTPVMTVDQPLFALAKQIQWRWPDEYGENQFVVVMGGLHIEMTALRVVGDWLEGSGWTSALVKANITTPGRAEAMVDCNHVTRTRWAHEVTAASLYVLLKMAHDTYQASLSDDAPLHFEEWCTIQSAKYPQFKFWSLALYLELLVLQYVKSLRDGRFDLYVESLDKLAPWMFAMDHTHYSRWLPVHIRDMVQLEQKTPDIYREFVKGHFTVQKTNNHFSSIALDHNHEQLNKLIKGDGGAIGLTENPAALLRWMVAGPEMARLLEEFKSTNHKGSGKHHDQSKSTQLEFQANVKHLVETFQEMGNPFLDEGSELVALHTKVVMDNVVVQTLNKIEEVGSTQYEEFTNKRLVLCQTALSDTIPKNKFKLFQRPKKKGSSRSQYQIRSLKADTSLFSKLYIGCQARDGNLTEFFQYENSACPPSLTSLGGLRPGTKSDLLDCLQATQPKPVILNDCPAVDAEILDGAAIVHMLVPPKPKTPGASAAANVPKTFNDYAADIFAPYIINCLKRLSRLDIVWDRYIDNSLKQSTRDKRGHGERQRVVANAPLPSNWQIFLNVDKNKEELFAFLADYLVREVHVPDKVIVTSSDTKVLSTNAQADTSGLEPCSHEEADSRIMVHLADCVKQGYEKVLIRTTDTDVVVLAVFAACQLHLNNLAVAFGTGSSFRYIDAHSIASNIGPEKSKALPLFHSLTGCDTVSFLAGYGKKSFWDVWKVYPNLTQTLIIMGSDPMGMSVDDFDVIQRFVVLVYSRTCEKYKVNEARKQLFSQGTRSIERIPPTEAALKEHCKRAIYQGCFVWGQTFTLTPGLPSPEQWGWEKVNGDWNPFWSPLSEASKMCHELISCGCKVACRGNCKCNRNTLPCTDLCACEGGCYMNNE